MFDFLGFNKQLSDVRAQIDKQAAAINAKKENLKRLRTSPPQKEDVIAHFDAAIDRQADNYDTALQFSVDRLSGDPLHFDKVDGIRVLSAVPPMHQPSLFTMEDAILALFREDIKTSLRKRIESMPWAGDAGPRIADRPALIEKVERELAVLEKVMAELRNQVAQAGIII